MFWITSWTWLLESGKLFSFGGNEDGQLGHGDREVNIVCCTLVFIFKKDF